MVKQALKRRKPGFSETYHGFRTFSKLLEEAEPRKLLEPFYMTRNPGIHYQIFRARWVISIPHPNPVLSESILMTATDPTINSVTRHCISGHHPATSPAWSRLFELPVASPANCRVLELGCATGGNLILWPGTGLRRKPWGSTSPPARSREGAVNDRPPWPD